MNRVFPPEFISGILRAEITDVNTSRSSNWIYPDKPRLLQISANRNNFPRVGIVEMRPPSTVRELGIGGTETEDEVTLGINVYTVKEQLLTVTSTSQSFTFDVEDSDLSVQLTVEPITTATVTGTVGGVAYTFIKEQDYILIDNNSDGRYDGIQWTTDGDKPDDETSFTVTGIRQLAGEDLSRHLAHTIHMYLRDNWRDDIAPTLYGYQKLDMNTVPELDGTIARTELRVKFSGINIGD